VAFRQVPVTGAAPAPEPEAVPQPEPATV
jgi:hypothetical protein